MVHKIRHLKLLLQGVRGKATNGGTLKHAASKAQCTWTSTLDKEILLELRCTWRALDKYMKDEVTKKEWWLKELAETAASL